jgi:hypothetical protein
MAKEYLRVALGCSEITSDMWLAFCNNLSMEMREHMPTLRS